MRSGKDGVIVNPLLDSGDRIADLSGRM